MSSESKKLTKGQLLGILIVLVLLAVVITCVVLFKSDNAKKLLEDTMTSEELEEKAIAATSQYNYAKMLLDQQITLSDGTQVLEEYILSAEKNGSKRTYTYLSADGSTIFEYWDKDTSNTDTDQYDVYIYSEVYETWVNTKLTEEPVSNDLWGMLSVIDGYTVLEDKQNWYVTGEECYVLQLLGSSDDLYAIYEEMYINAETFLPVGIVEYCVAEDSGKTIKDLSEEDLDLNMEDYEIENATIEASSYSELLRVYQLEYSNEDLALVEKPETFITDEDYMYLEYTYNQEDEVEESSEESEEVIENGEK